MALGALSGRRNAMNMAGAYRQAYGASGGVPAVAMMAAQAAYEDPLAKQQMARQALAQRMGLIRSDNNEYRDYMRGLNVLGIQQQHESGMQDALLRNNLDRQQLANRGEHDLQGLRNTGALQQLREQGGISSNLLGMEQQGRMALQGLLGQQAVDQIGREFTGRSQLQREAGDQTMREMGFEADARMQLQNLLGRQDMQRLDVSSRFENDMLNRRLASQENLARLDQSGAMDRLRAELSGRESLMDRQIAGDVLRQRQSALADQTLQRDRLASAERLGALQSETNLVESILGQQGLNARARLEAGLSMRQGDQRASAEKAQSQLEAVATVYDGLMQRYAAVMQSPNPDPKILESIAGQLSQAEQAMMLLGGLVKPVPEQPRPTAPAYSPETTQRRNEALLNLHPAQMNRLFEHLNQPQGSGRQPSREEEMRRLLLGR